MSSGCTGRDIPGGAILSMVSGIVFVVCLLVVAPLDSLARENTLTVGLSTAFDYDHPKYDSVDAGTAGTEGEEENENVDTGEDDAAFLVFKPFARILSKSSDGQLEFRTAPGIKYDLIDSEPDWDLEAFLAAAQSINRWWKMSASDTLLRSDRHFIRAGAVPSEPEVSGPDVSEQVDTANGEQPELSADRGRSRYWLNDFKLVSEHPYGKDSQLQAGFTYRVLRNDESEVLSYEDYDRYEMSVKNGHRFTSAWKTGAEAIFVRGTFDDVSADSRAGEDSATLTGEDELSEDLWEYRATAAIENNSFRHHTPAIEYSYIGARYDATEQEDSDIHEMQFSWRYEYSRHLAAKLGAGPSYEKTEGQDANWGGNGIAQFDYLFRNGTASLAFEKGFDVDNFSGANERGTVDFWTIRFGVSYLPLDSLSCSVNLAYRQEERTEPSEAVNPREDLDNTDDGPVESEEDQYSAGFGLRYAISTTSSTGINYTYIREDSDDDGEDYQDHRVVVSYSWQNEWLRW